MKNFFKMTSFVRSLSALAVLMSFSLQAQELILPQITAPSALEEGTQRELSVAQIAELLPWAKESKSFLSDLLDQVQGLPTEQKIERLSQGIKQVVVESSTKHSELLMRYVLNRSLVVLEILNQETSDEFAGSADAKLRVLLSSIYFALKYYEVDLAFLTKKSALPFTSFGKDYFFFLHEINKSIFDASAQFAVQRLSLEFLQWDLYRDVNNTVNAPQIVKINNALKIYPKKSSSDRSAISYIQQMKKLIQQLNLNNLIAPINVIPGQNIKEIDSLKSKTDPEFRNNLTYPSYLNDSNGYCRAVSPIGKFEMSNYHESSKCAYAFAVDRVGYCRAVDVRGNLSMTDYYESTKCAAQYLVDKSGYCRAADMNGNLAMTDYFESSKCASKYLADKSGYCRAADAKGNLAMTDYYEAAKCASQYLVDKSGYCRAGDSKGNLAMTEYFESSKCANSFRVDRSGYCRASDSAGNLAMTDYYDSMKCSR